MPTAIIFDLKSGSNSVCLDFFRVSPISRHSFVNQNNIFLINSVDNTVLDKLFINYNIIYAGTHGGEILNKATMLLPLKSEYETENLYINIEHRMQKNFQSIKFGGQSRSLKNLIINLLDSDTLKKNKYFEFYKESLKKSDLFSTISLTFSTFFKSSLNKNNQISLYPQKPMLEDFFRSNQMSKKSMTMSQCSQEFRKSINNFY